MPGPQLRGEWPQRVPLLNQFDPHHQATLPHFGDVPVSRQPGQPPRDQLRRLLRVPQDPALFKQRQRGQRCGTPQRVPRISMPMEERLPLGRLSQEGVKDLRGGQRRRQGEIAPGDSLREAQQVGGHLLLLAGEERPRAAKAGRHFVGDQREVQFAGQVANPLEIARGMHQHSRRPLHQWFHNDRGDLRGMRAERPLEFGMAVGQVLGGRHSGGTMQGDR